MKAWPMIDRQVRGIGFRSQLFGKPSEYIGIQLQDFTDMVKPLNNDIDSKVPYRWHEKTAG